jgi:hypothetical protein
MGKPDALTQRYKMLEGTKAKDQPSQKLIPEEKFVKESFGISAILGEFGRRIQGEQNQDEWAKEKLKQIGEKWKELEGFSIEDNTLYFNNKVYILKELRREVLESVHDDLSAGHFGRDKMLELARRSYWWPKLKEDIDRILFARKKSTRLVFRFSD